MTEALAIVLAHGTERYKKVRHGRLGCGPLAKKQEG